MSTNNKRKSLEEEAEEELKSVVDEEKTEVVKEKENKDKEALSEQIKKANEAAQYAVTMSPNQNIKKARAKLSGLPLPLKMHPEPIPFTMYSAAHPSTTSHPSSFPSPPSSISPDERNGIMQSLHQVQETLKSIIRQLWVNNGSSPSLMSSPPISSPTPFPSLMPPPFPKLSAPLQLQAVKIGQTVNIKSDWSFCPICRGSLKTTITITQADSVSAVTNIVPFCLSCGMKFSVV